MTKCSAHHVHQHACCVCNLKENKKWINTRYCQAQNSFNEMERILWTWSYNYPLLPYFNIFNHILTRRLQWFKYTNWNIFFPLFYEHFYLEHSVAVFEARKIFCRRKHSAKRQRHRLKASILGLHNSKQFFRCCSSTSTRAHACMPLELGWYNE